MHEQLGYTGILKSLNINRGNLKKKYEEFRFSKKDVYILILNNRNLLNGIVNNSNWPDFERLSDYRIGEALIFKVIFDFYLCFYFNLIIISITLLSQNLEKKRIVPSSIYLY